MSVRSLLDNIASQAPNTYFSQADRIVPALLPAGRPAEAHSRRATLEKECVHHRCLALLHRGAVRPLGWTAHTPLQCCRRLCDCLLRGRLVDALDRLPVPHGSHVNQPYLPPDPRRCSGGRHHGSTDGPRDEA